jgi:hypothetical protein
MALQITRYHCIEWMRNITEFDWMLWTESHHGPSTGGNARHRSSRQAHAATSARDQHAILHPASPQTFQTA